MPGPGADLDLRLVRYFVAVAEHLNFGRAAQALHIAQPSLSRQIRRLEQTIGVRLLQRDTQGSVLTTAGEMFLPRAQSLLRQADHAVQAAHGAAPARTITVGYVEDLIITPVIRELRRRHPDIFVRTRHLRWSEARGLAEGVVDVMVVRTPLPFPGDDLDLELLVEHVEQVLVLPRSHPLAGRQTIRPEDLEDDSLAACSKVPPGSIGFWILEPSPINGRTSLAPLNAGSIEDKLELIADGQALALMPAADHRLAGRDDLALVAVAGFGPASIAVATRAGENVLLAEEFKTIARKHLGHSRRGPHPERSHGQIRNQRRSRSIGSP